MTTTNRAGRAFTKTHGNCVHSRDCAESGYCECSCGMLVPQVLPKTGLAGDCPDWESKDGKLHIDMVRVEAHYFGGYVVGDPMHILITCDDGYVYEGDKSRILQARVAKWRPLIYNYSENGEMYACLAFSGAGLPVVLDPSARLKRS